MGGEALCLPSVDFLSEEVFLLNSEYVSVYILESPYHADKMYDYFVPPELSGIGVGSIVTVPFGRSNRKTMAVVAELKSDTDTDADRIKPVAAVTRPSLLSTELLSICAYMKEHTLCTFGDAVRAVVPAAAMSKINEYYSAVAGKDADGMSERCAVIYSYVSARDKVSLAVLRQEFGKDAVSSVKELVQAGVLQRDREDSTGDGIRRRLMCALAVPVETAAAIADGEVASQKLRSAVQAELLRCLVKLVPDEDDRNERDGFVSADELFELCPEGDRVRLKALEKKGLVVLREDEISRNPYSVPVGQTAAASSPLTEEQAAAVRTLGGLLDSGEPKAALLHGVTGSGKTRVIIEMIRRTLDGGRDAIVLVPEIALTPQTVGIFLSAFGERVAVIHSGLSAGERFDAWRRVKDGGADVVIGTRSAVFAPVERLGLIVIDEEQEHTYKSDINPKYLAHDIARKRCADMKAMMLLASATPSVGSYYKAKQGIYTLVEMKERYGGATLPEVLISDTRGELLPGASPYGALLREKICETAADDKQSIIFLNRRGYSSVLSCRNCGEPIRCPHCSVSLTYHTYRHLKEGEGESYLKNRADSGTLSCHYCGFRTKVPDVCPECGSTHMLFMGYGTQRAEEELSEMLPGVPVIRMDTDTTRTKFSHDEILSRFRRGDAKVLLGTQIVTKGHDFPKVTLVGVLNADASLYLDDYRAAERTFAMLTQVIGRAGRAVDKGVAVIQTQNPDSDVIRLAAAQDYPAFFEQEIRIRRGLVFPPFCDMAVFTLTSPDEALLGVGAKRLSEMIREMLSGKYSDVKTVVFGPFEAPVYKVQNNCRMRMVIKCKLSRRTREMLSEILCNFGHKATKRLTISVDLNPSSL